VRAPHAGTVGELSVEAGQPVTTGQVVCTLT
jgi:biotin carboxyl carrier protein